MDTQQLLNERAALFSDIVKDLQNIIVREDPPEDDRIEAEMESKTLSEGRSPSTSDSDSTLQTEEERNWINDTPKWTPPTDLALHSANSSSTSEWRKACGDLHAVVSREEMFHVPVTKEFFDSSAFRSLTIKPRKKDLRKLKHAIQQPVQPPYLAEVIFDCKAIRTKEDVDNLEKCREPLVDILKLLYEQGRQTSDEQGPRQTNDEQGEQGRQTGDAVPVHPIRDALILLLEAFLFAIETKQETWCSWNTDDPEVRERPQEMQASCSLTYLGIGPMERDLPRFKVYFDYGLDIDNLTVSEFGEKTVPEVWLCMFEDYMEFGRVLINGWPGTSRPYLDYNLIAFETLLMTTKMRRIEIRNTKVHLGGLLSLLNRNRHTLDILVLEQVEADEDIDS